VRKATEGKRSLDDVMRTLWAEYGATSCGVGEAELESLIQRVTGVRLKRFFDRMLRSTEDIEWAPLMRHFGMRMRIDAAQSAADRGGNAPRKDAKPTPPRAVLGARLDTSGSEVKVAQVFDGGAAQAGGLSAGDILVAIDGIRITPANWEQLLGRHHPGDSLRVTGFRRDELFERDVRLMAAPANTFSLWQDPSPSARQRRRLTQWLASH
jgi:predicted metalloprotease with PDZ domain